MAQRVIYTIGHSHHAFSVFTNLLCAQSVALLADIRSHPVSRFAPHFSAPEFGKALLDAEIRYCFFGEALGGKPRESDFYDAQGAVRYDRIAESPRFQKGLERLETLAQETRTALCCSEENPARCHRRLLVARVLIEKGWEVRHLRGEGAVQTEQEIFQLEEAARNDGGQQSLFAPEEVSIWRSTPSASPKSRRKSFLEG